MKNIVKHQKQMSVFLYASIFILSSILLISCGNNKENDLDIPQDETQNQSQTEENSQTEEQSQVEEQESLNMVITAEEAKQIMESTEDYLILDVREQDEYDSGHIAGAILISYTELANRAETELPNKDQLILVYCRSGRRSAIAAKTLAELGYTNVRDFGGIIDWPYETEK